MGVGHFTAVPKVINYILAPVQQLPTALFLTSLWWQVYNAISMFVYILSLIAQYNFFSFKYFNLLKMK